MAEVVGVANEREFAELVKLLVGRYDGRVTVVCEGLGTPELEDLQKLVGDGVEIDVYALYGLTVQQHVTFRPRQDGQPERRPANDD